MRHRTGEVLMSRLPIRFRSLGDVKELWERQWFVLDGTRFVSGIGRHYLRGRGYVPPKNREKEEPGPDHYQIPIKDIITIDRCTELALPEGEAFWIQTHTYPQVTRPHVLPIAEPRGDGLAVF